MTTQVFYQTLIASQKQTNPYWQTLAAITRATRSQIDALASDLAWQTWGAESQPTTK